MSDNQPCDYCHKPCELTRDHFEEKPDGPGSFMMCIGCYGERYVAAAREVARLRAQCESLTTAVAVAKSELAEARAEIGRLEDVIAES